MNESVSVRVYRALGIGEIEIDLSDVPEDHDPSAPTHALANKAAKIFHADRPVEWGEVSKAVKESYERNPSLRVLRSSKMRKKCRR